MTDSSSYYLADAKCCTLTKHVTLPKTSKKFDDMLNEFSEDHQHRGLATVSPKKKRKRHAHSASRDSSCEDRKHRHKRSRKESDTVKGKSNEDLFHFHRVPPESTGRKKRIMSVIETSAVSECKDNNSGAPVTVSEEEIIIISAIQEFCNNQNISDISMTLQDILEKATSVPGTPAVRDDLKEQDEDIVLAFHKVAPMTLYSPPTIGSHLNMVKYWASKQSLETLSGPYLNVLYKELGLVYLENFHETFSRGFRCIMSSVRASMMYDSMSPHLSEETHRITSLFADKLKEVCMTMSKEDVLHKVFFAHGRAYFLLIVFVGMII